jgi:hypothetical protein
MPPVGLEPTTLVFERAKRVYALVRVDTVISSVANSRSNYHESYR